MILNTNSQRGPGNDFDFDNLKHLPKAVADINIIRTDTDIDSVKQLRNAGADVNMARTHADTDSTNVITAIND